MNTVFDKMKVESQDRIDILRKKLSQTFPEGYMNDNVCIYACGSLGRLEMTENSDLDLFFVIDDEESPDSAAVANLDKYLFFANLYNINHELKFQDPSKRGMYWDFITKRNLLDIGSREEDYNNSFTARMLLILESKPLYNENAYRKIVSETVAKYFADYEDYEKDFYPLFLMNDILRYWYTLTLNYEYRRDDSDTPNKRYWKRLKLKYARLITCYSMLACLYIPKLTPAYVVQCVELTPFERLRMIASKLEGVSDIVAQIEAEYKWYLDLRTFDPEWWETPANKEEAFTKADQFHNLVVHKFMRKVSDGNQTLRDKADTY